MSNPYHESTLWEEVRPGVYHRPFGDNERTYITIGSLGQAIDREPWQIHVTGVFTIASTTDPIPALRQAWKALRTEFPSLATTLDLKSARLVYESLRSDADLDAWADRTFVVEPPESIAGDLFSAQPILHLPMCHILSAPVDSPDGSVQVALRSNHWRTDGIGVLYLLDHFIAHASANLSGKAALVKADGSEVANLPTPVEAQYGASPAYDETLTKHVEAEFALLAQNAPGVGFPFEPNLLPTACRARGLGLSEEATSTLVSACKAQGLNVTAALHAAIAEVMYKHATEQSRNRPYVTPTPVSLRQYLPNPLNMSVSHSGVQIIAPAESLRDFKQAARIFKQWYDISATRDWLQQCARRAVEFEKFAQVPPSADKPPPSHFMMNSIGIIERFVQPEREGVSVRHVAVGVDVLTPETVFYVRTFRGRLELEACFNEAFYRADMIEKWTREVVQVVERALEIKLL